MRLSFQARARRLQRLLAAVTLPLGLVPPVSEAEVENDLGAHGGWDDSGWDSAALP